MSESVELATIYLVDLVGSTQLATAVGPVRADELREEFFASLREGIDSFGVKEFKNTGDGLFVAFSSASAAVGCAVLTQQLFERRYRRSEQQLHVRIGLGTGESTVIDGDYFGMPSIEAARLCDKAPADGVLVSALTKQLAGRVEGARFESVGELELKGIPDPLEAFAVLWEPLADESGAALGGWPLPSALRSVPALSYVGRAAERELVERSRANVQAGARQVVLLSGEPGIGKTRLASYEALTAHGDGFAVGWGACSEELAVPYEPWIEVCSQLVEHAPEHVLAGYVERSGGELSRLARNLPHRVPGVPAPQSSDPETERFLLFQAVAHLLRAVAEAVPVCVVLDDFHWADGQSVALLKHVARTVDEGALQLLVTYRDTDLGKDDPLTAVLADLRRIGGVERIPLTGLGVDEVAAMMAAAAGHDLDADGLALAGELASETDGNPFFVGEILRSMSESGMVVFDEATGRWSIDRSSGIGLPESVREVVERRVEQLGEKTRRILTAASVLGRSFDVEVLTHLLGRSEDEILDALDIAIESSVVAESPERVGRFSFTHALINDTLYQSLTATRRARMHQQVAEALEALCGQDPGERLPELAHHWSRAVATTDRVKAVGYAREAGEQALAQLAPGEALRWFNQALELLGSEATDEDRCELLIGIGMAQKHAGDPAFRETLLEAAGIARRTGNVQGVVRATLENGRGWVARIGDVDAERIEMLEAAIGAVDPASADSPILRAQLASELAFADDWPRVSQLIEDALAVARERDDRPLLAHVLHLVISAQLGSADAPPTVWDLAGELELLADELADPARRWAAAWGRWCAAIQLGEVDEVDRTSAAMRRFADELGQPTLQWATAYYECARQLLYGDVAAAEAAAYEAAALGHESGQPDAPVIAAAQLFAVRAEQARLGELIELLEQRVVETPGLPALEAALVYAYVELDRIDDARAIFDRVAADDFASLPFDIAWLNGMARYADVAARLAARDAAAVIYDRLLPYRDRIVTPLITVSGSAERLLGMLAATLGRWETAEAHFTRAEEFHQRIGAELWLARTWMNHGRALLARSENGDLARATELLERAVALAHEHSGAAIVRDAEMLLADRSVDIGIGSEPSAL